MAMATVSAQTNYYADAPTTTGYGVQKLPDSWNANLKVGDVLHVVAQRNPDDLGWCHLDFGYMDDSYHAVSSSFQSSFPASGASVDVSYEVTSANVNDLKKGLAYQHNNLKISQVYVTAAGVGKLTLKPSFAYNTNIGNSGEYANWGLAPVTVVAGDNNQAVNTSAYTLSYEVTEGQDKVEIVNGDHVKALNVGTATVKVTATPIGTNADSYNAGSGTCTVTVKPAINGGVAIVSGAPDGVAQIGTPVTLKFNKEHTDVPDDDLKYEWSIDGNDKNNVVRYDDEVKNQSTFTFCPMYADDALQVRLTVRSNSGDYQTHWTGFFGNDLSIEPVNKPTITQSGSNVTMTTFGQLYWTIDGGEENHVWWPTDPATSTITPPANSVIEVWTQRPFDYNGTTYYVQSERVRYIVNEVGELPSLDFVKQPKYNENYPGLAKEYFAIGQIEFDGKAGQYIGSQWTSGSATTVSGTGAKYGNRIGYILGSNNYDVDPVKGINISQFGHGFSGTSRDNVELPNKGAIMFKVAGTMDITLFCKENRGSVGVEERSHIRVYYMNDQTDGKMVQMHDWRIDNERGERYISGNVLTAHVRLPQLGKNGSAIIVFAYDRPTTTSEADARDDFWIKGFVVKRPDLCVTIGRTDDHYTAEEQAQVESVKNNTSGVNVPYVWSFGTDVICPDHNPAVGFQPTVDTDSKKLNQYDGRTYLCGKKCDHVLIYCNTDDVNKRPEFDGRSSRATKEHIEFPTPSTYDINSGDPITANGLKVNVTGSGWFKIWASAPTKDLKLKVLSSLNTNPYNNASSGGYYIKVLREWDVKKSTKDEAGAETDWQEYTVYLKAHVDNANPYDKDVTEGDRLSNRDPEARQMSLYVVFDGEEGAQLNIHKMSWLNEIPMDYVYQREEDPKLLTTMQRIGDEDSPNLYWQAGTRIRENGQNTYDRTSQITTTTGQVSLYGSESRETTSDDFKGKCKWDIAAPASTNAHTEAAAAVQGYAYTAANEYQVANASSIHEFALPISGSFVRLCPMKNGTVFAYVIPGGDGGKLYVLDETGAPIKFNPINAQEVKALGRVTAAEGSTNASAGTTEYNYSSNTTVRLNIEVNAGKEYFICTTGTSLSVAALHWWNRDVTNFGTGELKDENNGNPAVANNLLGAANYEVSGWEGHMYTNIKLNRTFEAGKWYSLVLPFSMNEKKFEEVFGEGAECIHFTKVDGTQIHLTQHFYNMVVAGRPVFIKPSVTVTNPTITDVTLQTATVTPTVSGDWTFTGSMNPTQAAANALFISNDGTGMTTFYHTNKAKNMPALRAWVQGAPGAAAPTMLAVFEDYEGNEMESESANAIVEVLAEQGLNVVTKSTKIYDTNGRVVSTGASMNNLPSGVYIVNGKKYVK